MSGQIRIDPETMRSRSAEYNNCGDDIEQVISKMDSLLQQLQGEWEGSASEAYAARYTEELRPSFEKAVTLTREIADALTKAAANMEEQDRSIASGFSG